MLLNNLPTIFRLFYPHFGTFFVNFCHCKTIPKCILQSLNSRKNAVLLQLIFGRFNLCWRILEPKKDFKLYNHFAIWHLGLAKKFPQMIQKIIHCFLTICFMLVWQLVSNSWHLLALQGDPTSSEVSKKRILECLKTQKIEF